MSRETEIRKTLVVEMIDQGLRRQEIADKLHVSLSTVKRSLGEIYREYGVSKRSELLMKLSSGDIRN